MLPALISFEGQKTSGLSGTHLNLGEIALLLAQSELFLEVKVEFVTS